MNIILIIISLSYIQHQAIVYNKENTPSKYFLATDALYQPHGELAKMAIKISLIIF